MNEGVVRPGAWWVSAAVAGVWLIPQHYLPWLTAHQDFAALVLLCVAGLLSCNQQALPRAWAVAILLAWASIVFQWASGSLAFSGDALVAAVYVAAFAGAVAIGHTLGQSPGQQRLRALTVLALGSTLAAIASVAVALMQWAEVQPIPLPITPLRWGDRPYANFAQANQFCTATFLGLCALCWLRDANRIGAFAWTLGSTYLMIGMVMSGSRTAWLQVALLCVILAFQKSGNAGVTTGRLQALALIGTFVLLQGAWPLINDWAQVSGVRDLVEQSQVGHRLPLWTMMLDAVSRQPWGGYGWQQVPSAQLAVALDHPPLQRYFEHSHNLILDLMLWAGLPVGAGITTCAAAALVGQARAITDPMARTLFAAILGVLAHAMLELPLEYAYLLVPFGLLIGAVHGLSPGQTSWRLAAPLARAAWIGLSVLLVVIATDYIRVEQDYRSVRLESAFGSRRITTPAPSLQVLTQLEAYLRFIRTEAKPNMSPTELDEFRKLASRYAHPPVLLRLALAEGLNGQPVASAATLKRLCFMHLAARCAEGRESWQSAQQIHPQLLSIPAPEVPVSR